MKRMLTALCLCLCGLLTLLPGCGSKTAQRYQYTYLDVFDTVTTMILYAPSQQQADSWAAMLHDRLIELNRLYTIYDAYEDTINLQTVNSRAGEPVTVDERIFSLLERGQEAYTLSSGKVNIAMGSVLSLWHDARTAALADPATAALPDEAALKMAATHCDIENLRLDPEHLTVRLADPDMSLDVGAIAKGYAAAMTADFAEELGITSALLSIGGNVVAVGGKPDDSSFIIGIEDPLGENQYALKVRVRDCAVVTSGNYQRYFTVDGVRYHHLIDPDTCFPADFTASVSVIGPDSGMADILSTALFLLPPEEGQALLNTARNYEAVWILKDGTQIFSTGFDQYADS